MMFRCTDNLDDDEETHRVGAVIDYGYNAVVNKDPNISNSSNRKHHQYNQPQQGTSYAGGKAYSNEFRANYINENKQPEIQYCHYWAKGNCTRVKCRFVHELDPSKTDKRPTQEC